MWEHLLFAVLFGVVLPTAHGAILVGDAASDTVDDTVNLYTVDLSQPQPTPTIFYTISGWSGVYFGGCADYELSQVFLLRAADEAGTNVYVETVSYPSGKALKSNGTFPLPYGIISIQCDNVWHKMVVTTTDGSTFRVHTVDPGSGSLTVVLDYQHNFCSTMFASTYNSVLHTVSFPEATHRCGGVLELVWFTEVNLENATVTKNGIPDSSFLDYSALQTGDDLFYGAKATGTGYLSLFLWDQSGREELVQNSAAPYTEYWHRTGVATNTSFFMLAAESWSTAQVYSWDLSSGICSTTAPLGLTVPFTFFFGVIQP